jgi:hypothetical protein
LSGATLEVVAAEGLLRGDGPLAELAGPAGVVATGSIGRDDAGRMVVLRLDLGAGAEAGQGRRGEVVAIEVDGTSFARGSRSEAVRVAAFYLPSTSASPALVQRAPRMRPADPRPAYCE